MKVANKLWMVFALLLMLVGGLTVGASLSTSAVAEDAPCQAELCEKTFDEEVPPDVL